MQHAAVLLYNMDLLFLFVCHTSLTNLDPNPQGDKYGMVNHYPGGKITSRGPVTVTKTSIKSVIGVPASKDDLASFRAREVPPMPTRAPVDPHQRDGIVPPVLIRGPKFDTQWARRSQAGRGRRPRERPTHYKYDVEPSTFSNLRRDYHWFEGLLKENRDSLTVGEELTSPTVLHGILPHPSTLSLSVDGSIMHKRPTAGQEAYATSREFTIQQTCPSCSWDLDLGIMSIPADFVILLETELKCFQKVRFGAWILTMSSYRV